MRELELICCFSGLLSVENNLARTFLRSNLFQSVVAYGTKVGLKTSINIFRTRIDEKVAFRDYKPHVYDVPHPTVRNRSTEIFFRYCAPNGRFRQSEGKVVFYRASNPMNPNLSV